MAKIKVHELAKELGKESKDVIAFLEANGIEAKAQSGIEDDMAAKVRAKFTPKDEKKAAPKQAHAVDKDGNPVKKPRPSVDKDGNPVKKKKNVFVVTRDRDDRRRRPGSDSSRNENRDNNGQKKAAAQPVQPRGPIRPRTFADGVRPSQRASAQSQDTEFVSKKNSAEETQERPARKERPERQDRNERPERNERRDNNRQDRPNRDNGDRPARGDRPAGKRPERNDRNDRGDRPARPDNRGDRNSRPSQNAAPDMAPSSNAKGGRRDDKKKKNGNNDRDNNLGGKKQERYINLEKNGGKKKKNNAPKAPERNMDEVLTITIPDRITIKDLADKMKVQSSAVVKTLFLKGKMVTVNQEVDFEEASEIALEFNCICEEEEKVDVIAELLKEDEEDTSSFPSRPPVVCVMGHVDHGKTSLLDAIRDTKVTDREAGGITQHIGAYTVSINNQDITFLDTPGHEAFTAMRMRGANSTDIAILVVAADDGVMPQTVEAINHAKAAGIEIIVAINKIDKPNANIDRVKQELSEYQLIPEDWGGSTVFCPVSAHTKEGIDNLLEMILLTAEVLELKANPNRKARGLVIEAQLDKGRGAVATVLVQKGTLHVGDPVACGSCYGKVRAMLDDTGARVKSAGPSVPVEILGLSEVPNAGEVLMSFDSEKEAHSFADTFVAEHKNKLVEQTKSKMSLDALFSEIESGNLKELDIIVKADVQGSVEAVKQSLEKLSNEEVVVKTIHGGVGTINESDVVLASASNAIIIGFNVRVDPQAKMTADREGVDLRLYKVIYDAINDVESAMKGMLDPIFEEKVIGHAEVRQIFKASGVGNIAGSYVTDGYFQRDCMVRVTREGNLIHEGKLGSLKRFKDDVKEVKTNFECGLVIEDFNDVQEMDIIEAYIMVEVPR
ncbi:translation initiation factor IF-2 [Pseudobutyrivibrio xylanivorans]|uniref:Translation initiation factor IF-2 n=1 Tax=Pseudobutyrivibrio xylanivorans DSM 14809 TaxID=1123012 RepID=A0A1M6BTM1_PSEXY|nr:translation initiation factor IF-2 [Pseudobutyrivibrio xylanivorans]SHI52115.1 translation initiation factor IF-2 [Pseudobutyrivibrio xylanivorans DSM 14809]